MAFGPEPTWAADIARAQATLLVLKRLVLERLGAWMPYPRMRTTWKREERRLCFML